MSCPGKFAYIKKNLGLFLYAQQRSTESQTQGGDIAMFAF